MLGMIAHDAQRLLGCISANKSLGKRMSTWVTKQFDTDMEKIEMSIPTIEKPDELLVKVKVSNLIFKQIHLFFWKLELCS